MNLQVRIVEVARNVDRRLGIRWNALSDTGGQPADRLLRRRRACPRATRARFQLGRGSFNIDVVLQALAEEGLVTIMAEPNLTARSGEGASFLAGGEFPYSVVNDDENTIEFKDYGIGLNFTPTVLDGDHISLKVATEVSELDFSHVVDTRNRVPGLKTRRAETTVDLASGQSFAIAGLMQNSSAQTDSKLPGLGTLPVIGALFKSNSFQRGQTELVIIVTPVIVRPTDRQARSRRRSTASCRRTTSSASCSAASRELAPGRARCRTASASAVSSASPASCSSDRHAFPRPSPLARRRALSPAARRCRSAPSTARSTSSTPPRCSTTSTSHRTAPRSHLARRRALQPSCSRWC